MTNDDDRKSILFDRASDGCFECGEKDAPNIGVVSEENGRFFVLCDDPECAKAFKESMKGYRVMGLE